MLSNEEENSKTILAIFCAIEERDAAQFRALLQPDFEIHWRRHYRMEELFGASSRSLAAGALLGSPCSRLKQSERWILKWLPLMAMML